MYLYSTCIYINIHNIRKCPCMRVKSHLNGTRSLRVSSLRRLNFVSRDEIPRDDRTARTDNPEDYAHQQADEELNVFRERPRLTFRLVEFLSVVLRPRDVAQPINEPVGGRIQSVAYRHGDHPRVLTISHRLVDLMHHLRDLHRRGVIVRGLHRARETQLDRASRIAGLVGVPR